MPRKRRALRERVTTGRPRQTDEMEEFLAGDNSVFANDRLLADLIGESFFMRLDVKAKEIELSVYEQNRIDRLEQHYWKWRLQEDHKRYRQMAVDCKVLRRYEMLIEQPEYRDMPSSAWGQALSPGPNSIVRGVPQDNEATQKVLGKENRQL